MDPRETATAEALADRASFRAFRKTALTQARQMDRPFTCATSTGTQDGRAGDYMVIGADGDPYPVTKEVFEKTYVESGA